MDPASREVLRVLISLHRRSNPQLVTLAKTSRTHWIRSSHGTTRMSKDRLWAPAS
jgi:hypothetical protein